MQKEGYSQQTPFSTKQFKAGNTNNSFIHCQEEKKGIRGDVTDVMVTDMVER